MTLLVLLVARIAVRIRHTPPTLPTEIPVTEQMLAHLGRVALYVLSVATFALGWATQNLGGDEVQWFGIAMPKVFPTMEFIAGYEADELAETLHMRSAYIMLATSVGHIVAALVHNMFERIDVLGRMTIDKP